jgi:hypothetical protein
MSDTIIVCPECHGEIEITASLCAWTEDTDDESWDTGCGQKFQFITGGPIQNAMAFCCYCGKPLAVDVPRDGEKGMPPALHAVGTIIAGVATLGHNRPDRLKVDPEQLREREGKQLAQRLRNIAAEASAANGALGVVLEHRQTAAFSDELTVLADVVERLTEHDYKAE